MLSRVFGWLRLFSPAPFGAIGWAAPSFGSALRLLPARKPLGARMKACQPATLAAACRARRYGFYATLRWYCCVQGLRGAQLAFARRAQAARRNAHVDAFRRACLPPGRHIARRFGLAFAGVEIRDITIGRAP